MAGWATALLVALLAGAAMIAVIFGALAWRNRRGGIASKGGQKFSRSCSELSLFHHPVSVAELPFYKALQHVLRVKTGLDNEKPFTAHNGRYQLWSFCGDKQRMHSPHAQKLNETVALHHISQISASLQKMSAFAKFPLAQGTG